MMLSDVCLSVAYIGPKSRTERPRKTKIGTEVAHVTRDSDTIFKVKRSKSHGGVGILWWPQCFDTVGWKSIWRVKQLSVGVPSVVSDFSFARQVSTSTISVISGCRKPQWIDILILSYLGCPEILAVKQMKGSVKEPNTFIFSAHHSIVFCFRCSVYWWKGSVRF